MEVKMAKNGDWLAFEPDLPIFENKTKGTNF